MKNIIKRIIPGFMTLIIIFSLFPIMGEAQGEYTLILRKVINQGNKNIEVIDGKIINHPNPEHIKPVYNAEFTIWHNANGLSIDKLNKMSVNELGSPVDVQRTDEDGFAYFYNLETGQYYIRETTSSTELMDGYRGVPQLVDLPHKDMHGNIKNPAYIYVKVVKPEKPEPEKPPKEPDGGRKFIKLDADTKIPLEGAFFKITTKETDANGKVYFKDVLVDGKPYVVKSDANGRFEFTNLPKGIYYVIETKTPSSDDGVYSLLKNPTEIIIDDKSIELEAIIVLNKKVPIQPPEKPNPNEANPNPPSPGKPTPSKPLPGPKPGIVIPETGEVQLVIYSVLGICFILIGIIFYNSKERV